MAVEKENVPNCVRSEKCLGRGGCRRACNTGRATQLGSGERWHMSDNQPVEARAALLIAPALDPATQGNVIFHVVTELSEADYDRYAEAYKTLDGILVANLFTYYLVATRSLASVWKEANQGFATAPLPISGGTDMMVSWAARLRGAVLSVVSALCYHQERTYEEICAKHGKNSPEHEAAKAIFGALYDDYFGYRYLYKLRNVMIHDTMLAVAIRAEAHANKGNPVALIELNMDRGALIESDKINATLKAELAAKPGDPSIIQMMAEIHRAMRKANRRLLTILHPDLTPVCETVVEFDQLFEGRDGARGLIRQQSPELRAPFTTGFTPWAGQVVLFARSYTTEDWNNPDDEDD
jgi:hypothetical protein